MLRHPRGAKLKHHSKQMQKMTQDTSISMPSHLTCFDTFFDMRYLFLCSIRIVDHTTKLMLEIQESHAKDIREIVLPLGHPARAAKQK